MGIDENQVPENEMGFEGLDWCADTGVMTIYLGEDGKPPSDIYVCVDGMEQRYIIEPVKNVVLPRS